MKHNGQAFCHLVVDYSVSRQVNGLQRSAMFDSLGDVEIADLIEIAIHHRKVSQAQRLFQIKLNGRDISV